MIRTGIMGFNYHAMEKSITNYSSNTHSPEVIEILTPSLLDQYQILWKSKSIHLFGRSFKQPCIQLKFNEINDSTWRFFLQPKIVIRGVARRLTAAFDEKGRALLVAVHGAIFGLFIS